MEQSIIRIAGRLVGLPPIVGTLTEIAHGQGVPLGAVCLSPGDAAARADARAECAQVAGDAGFQTGVLEPCTALDGEPLDQGSVNVTLPATSRPRASVEAKR